MFTYKIIIKINLKRKLHEKKSMSDYQFANNCLYWLLEYQPKVILVHL